MMKKVLIIIKNNSGDNDDANDSEMLSTLFDWLTCSW